MHFGLAGADTFKIQNVIDQAHKTICVADRDLHHLLELFWPVPQFVS